jgi:large subunit ribosomal protein L30
MTSKENKKIKITQIRSTIGCIEKQKRTIRALGIHKLNHSVIHPATPQIVGMVKKVRDLVRVEDVK